ncbi:carbamoyltransferase [Streptomyces sp. alain-838]|uniref:carbamoyltransferase family protein n=1 Tax=Streptomyces sp. DH24 TaxID=3040123 RepID=UPI000BC5EE2D|nr:MULTISPECIES: carbamoyltransferase C-terminal domain-containing protein [unclassified Streptomyces]MDG9717674.1 carbamoyltransferase C-terminal domain-containing protein [Streptomyces sp. DH24]PAK23654.1 carbamoyltransferase [Streptomyces sp. alain-838]
MRILGINALFHDPAAALVVDGRTVAAAEEERFSRRKHGKRPLPFSAWELPELSARWCLEHAGVRPEELDAVTYSYDPALARPAADMDLDDPFDPLRQDYARRAPEFLAEALPGLDPERVVFVPHHVAHAASAGRAAPHPDSAVLVLDGRGECASHLAGRYDDGKLDTLFTQPLPDSLGLLYEDLTQHLGFLRSSDEYKVMALASYGTPRHLARLRQYVHATGDGGFRAHGVDWAALAPPRAKGEPWTREHADLAASTQAVLEEVLLELVHWLHREAGGETLALAGGVALNCVANSKIATKGPYRNVWVQPAAGDAGTALGGALHLAENPEPMSGAALGRGWSDQEIRAWLQEAGVPFEEPADIAETVAGELARDGVVAWFQGRSEYGPRALGHRSLLAHPGRAENLERLNRVKGREEFRPVAPMVLTERAHEIFSGGPLPSPYMLFVHDVAAEWRERIPAVVHVDGTARIQTVDASQEPLVARMLTAFEQRTGVPVVVNTSLNTAGRPMVDDPRDALECFGSAPVDLLAIGPYAVRRGAMFGRA